MGFNFNPLIWFVCKLCRQTFSDAEKLKRHKLQSHLYDCLKIKCIVFEEKFLDHEWIPPDKLHSRNNYPLDSSANDHVLPLRNNCDQVNISFCANSNLRLSDSNSNKERFGTLSSGIRKRPLAQESSGSSAPLLHTYEQNHTQPPSSSSFPQSQSQHKKAKFDNDNDNDDLDLEIIHKSVPESNFFSKHGNISHKIPSELTIIENPKRNIKSEAIIQEETEPDSGPVLGQQMIQESRPTQATQQQQPQASDYFSTPRSHPAENNNDQERRIDMDKEFIQTQFLSLPSSTTVSIANPERELSIFEIQSQNQNQSQRERKRSVDQQFPVHSNPPNYSHSIFNPHEDSSHSHSSSVKVEFIEDFNFFENSVSGPELEISEQVTASPLISISDSIFQPHFLENSQSQNQNQSQSQLQNQSHYNHNANPAVATITMDNFLKPHMCETCFAIFESKSGLARHMVSHSTDRPFKCPYCPNAYKYNQLLRNHMIHHGRTTQHKCRYCGRSFHSKAVLDNHERTHTGDRPFKCQVTNCDYTFRFQSSLIVHTRMKHSEELGLQQFVCPNCGRTFGLKCYLKRHILTHHGGKMKDKDKDRRSNMEIMLN